MAKTVIVTIAPDGETVVKTTGFVGSECIAETDSLKQALGHVAASQATPEFYEQRKEVTRVEQGR